MSLKRIMWAALLGAAAATVFAGGKQAKGAAPAGLTLNEGKLLVGMEIGYPPMEYYAEDGKTPVGFDVLLAKTLGEKLGLQVEFSDTAWDGIFAGVNTGKYDCIISAVTLTEERKPNFNFTKPYIANSQVLVTLKDAAVKPTTVAGLAGLRMTYQAETTSDVLTTSWIVNEGLKAEVFEYDKVMNCFDELKLGRVDVIVVDSVVAAEYVKPGSPYEITAIMTSDEVLSICLKKGNDALTAALDGALDQLYAEGALQQISVDVFGEDYVTPARPVWP